LQVGNLALAAIEEGAVGGLEGQEAGIGAGGDGGLSGVGI
jgi:hypothetical protein